MTSPRTTPATGEPPALSVVIPFYNEEANAEAVLTELRAALDRLGLPWEVVMADDGSGDRTPGILAGFARDPRFRLLRFSSNRGQAAALWDGLRATRAPIVATLDGDGQNDPADLGELLRRLDRADMVVGIRAARRDSALRRAMSRLANAVRGRLLGDRMRDSGCALKVFRREVIDSFLPIRTLYSFMPAFAAAAGYRLDQVAVGHRERRGGTSSYGLWRFLWRPLVDMLGVWWFRSRRIPPAEAGPGAPSSTPPTGPRSSPDSSP